MLTETGFHTVRSILLSLLSTSQSKMFYCSWFYLLVNILFILQLYLVLMLLHWSHITALSWALRLILVVKVITSNIP